jgi:hypothetical protein
VSRSHGRLRLRGVIAGAALTLAVLAAGHPRPTAPLTAWTGEELAVTSAWALAVVGSAWLVVVSIACDLALRTRRTRPIELAAGLAPTFVRRLVEVAIVGSCVVSTAVPLGAAPSTTTAPPAVQDEPVVRSPARAIDQHPVAPLAPIAPAPAPLPPARPATHLVQAGDNLWRIARDELVARGNAQPDDATIARYWQTVIALNRRTLRSGNPSLIFAGELVALPEPG